jgi:hypothetical protein
MWFFLLPFLLINVVFITETNMEVFMSVTFFQPREAYKKPGRFLRLIGILVFIVLVGTIIYCYVQ